MTQEYNLYFGDLHNHNEVGYGTGSLERAYRIAQNALDFYAFTPHTYWPDLPTSDPKTQKKHEDGFRLVAEKWDEVQEMARATYRPGSFVSILAWEWHSLRWGDYCSYLPGDSGSFRYAQDLHELRSYAREAEALLIPHHIGYAPGARGLDWESIDPILTPAIEVYSEHGSSVEPYSIRSMYSHSMGGVQHTQTAIYNLNRGRRFGFLGGTDHHAGYPGSYGMGLTGLYAPELTREAILEALRLRHTYALTGDRMEIRFHLDEAMMGDTLSSDGLRPDGLAGEDAAGENVAGEDAAGGRAVGERAAGERAAGERSAGASAARQTAAGQRNARFAATARIHVRGWAPLSLVELVSNGRVIRALTRADLQEQRSGAMTRGTGARGRTSTGAGPETTGRRPTVGGPGHREPWHVLRIEWGWDGLGSREVTLWNLEGELRNGSALQAEPCFAGGAGSTTHTNELSLSRSSDRSITGFAVSSYTSRLNDHPVSGLALRWQAARDSRLDLRVHGEKAGTPFSAELSVGADELFDHDVQHSIFEAFTSPKLKIHRLIPASSCELNAETDITGLGLGNYVFLRVTQQNGQMGWSSPIWIGAYSSGSEHT